jgi:hypothetical protein
LNPNVKIKMFNVEGNEFFFLLNIINLNFINLKITKFFIINNFKTHKINQDIYTHKLTGTARL